MKSLPCRSRDGGGRGGRASGRAGSAGAGPGRPRVEGRLAPGKPGPLVWGTEPKVCVWKTQEENKAPKRD